MRAEEKGRFEMLWDCPACGTPKLLGLTHRHCPTCGAPQDPTKRYFPAAGEEVAVAGHPYQGADVICAGCDTPNAARSTFCVGCGSPLEGAKSVRTRADQAKGAKDSAEDAAREAEEERQKARQAAMAQHAAASGVKPARGGLGKVFAALGCLGVGGLLVVAVAVFFFWKKDAALVVTGHTWERSVAVETYGPTNGTAWKDSVPSGAYDLSCQKAERDKKKVADGETCTDKRRDKGDGTFAVVQECVPKYREEPVYDDRCSYTVNTWAVSTTERAQGATITPAPTWPTVALTRPGTCLGCQREGARKETYTVTLLDDATKAAHGCDLAQDVWSKMAVGSRWKAQVGVVSGALDCGALQPR